MEFSGAVLAGGKSKRFGVDKARFVWRGRPLLNWVMESLGGASERFVVANRDYSDLGFPVVADLIPGGDSLSGIHSALHHARHDWVAVAACDLPNLTPAYWRYLLERAGGQRAVVAMGPENWIEPLAALYHKELEPLAAMQLAAGDYFLKRFVELAEALIIPWEELEPLFGSHLFLNANRLEDLVGGGDQQPPG
ncbi:molybdenum cofactor guanylyltransferase [Oceanithermus sp.]